MVETQTKLGPAVYVRLTPEIKRKLEEIAARSVARSLSDHIRFAVEQYVEQHDLQPEGPQPA